MLTKIKVFIRIYNENLQKQEPFFSNEDGGGGWTRAWRAGPGSAFAILSMNNTLNRT